MARRGMMALALVAATHVHAHWSPKSIQNGSTYNSSWMGLPGSIYQQSEPWGYSMDSSWPLSSLGTPISPQKHDLELQQMLGEVDDDRIERIVSTLVNFGTRHTLSTQNSTTRGIGAARDWLYKEMLELARLSNGSSEVFFNSYIQDEDSDSILFPVNITNLVTRINGTEDPDRVYVVTGHYDSRRIDILDYESDAPGADDDATGVAVVLEMARICAKRRPKATMIFAAVAGEEQALYGSAHLAATLKNASQNVAGNWNNDIVGTGKSQPFAPINQYTVRLFGASIFYPNASTASLQQTTALIGGWNDSPAQNLGRFIAEIAAGAARFVGMQVKSIYRTDFCEAVTMRASLTQGFPAVRFTEAVEDFAHQHQDPREQDGIQHGDLLEFVDFDYTARVAKVNLASMYSAANAPRMPGNVTISTEVGFPAASENKPPQLISNDSKFSWITSDDAAGYELVWRPSGNLQWTHYLDVGNTGSVTVALGKDDFQFGIRSVGKDGKKSPAVFPLPG